MIRFSADYFDGRTSHAYPVWVVVDDQLRVEGERIEFTCPISQITVAPPAGQARGVITLPDGAELHSSDQEALLALSRQHGGNRPEQWARFLESKMRYAVVALLVSVFVLFAGLRWGIPVAASIIVKVVPTGLEKRLGNESLAVMDRVLLAPSELPETHRQALTQQLARYCQQQACPDYTLYFRHSPGMGANAFALPGGGIVVTDQLVQLAQHDEEVLAVIAHELGHVEGRHGLRLALQSMGAGVLLVAITGDVSNFSELAAGLPSMLLSRGYSRDMEREADDFALQWLNEVCLSPQRFADILQRIDTGEGEGNNLLSSHPGSTERIVPFLTGSACHGHEVI